MDIYTKNPKINTLNKIEVDSGGRETAACRWEKYKETTQRTALYHVSAPNITPEDSLLILELERLYIETYSEWEASTINDVQYKILQDYLPPEYFLDVLAMYLCTRYYDLPGTIEEIKNKKFNVTEEDRHYFINYLNLIYLPTVTEFTGKYKELRPRSAIYADISNILNDMGYEQDNAKSQDPEKSSKLSNLILEINMGMHIFLMCFNDGKASTVTTAEIFGDFAETLSANSLLKAETAPDDKPKAQAIYTEALESIIKPVSPSILELPVDKINNNIWGPANDKKKITFAMENPADKKKGREVNLVYAVDFAALEDNEALNISKKLTPFDKRVYMAVAALYNAGNEVFSLTQIYIAMGNTGRPSKAALQKISDSLTKLMKASINISNDDEAKSYNYKKIVYNGSLLPMERISNVNIKGKVVESAIHPFREPPMLTFAKEHGNQLTTVNIKVLQSPVSKTDENLQIDDYLIERISKAKNGTLSKKILIKSICERANITSKKQQGRLPEKLARFLDHYKESNFIKGYTLTKDSIIIDC